MLTQIGYRTQKYSKAVSGLLMMELYLLVNNLNKKQDV